MKTCIAISFGSFKLTQIFSKKFLIEGAKLFNHFFVNIIERERERFFIKDKGYKRRKSILSSGILQKGITQDKSNNFVNMLPTLYRIVAAHLILNLRFH